VTYGQMRWNTPLSEDHADLLLRRLDLPAGNDVLDLGCGWGELLMRAVGRNTASRGTGVDNAEWAIERGRDLAIERAVVDRVTFVAGDASTWTDSADRVICIGASQAWGGSTEALRTLPRLVRPGGRLLFGDGCWEQPPTAAATALFGEAILNLADLVNESIQAGWRILHLSTADQREWDDFESTWRAGREQWLLAHPSDPRSSSIRTELETRLHEYLTLYRGVLGFAYLVVAR
jgi:cyclopropane fatty-acyl-phospholipid synthase-like methyltransferase